MDIFGIGALEILFIMVIALIVMGPDDLQKTGRAIGKFLRKIVTSDSWRMFQETSKDLRNIPNRLIREAGLEEMKKDLNSIAPKNFDISKDINKELGDLKDDINSWVTPPPLIRNEEKNEKKAINSKDSGDTEKNEDREENNS